MLLLAAQDPSGWSGSLAVLGRLFSVVFAMGFVMVSAYYVTKWIAGARYIRRGKSNLRIVEGIGVGYQGNVQLIQAGEKFILIGVTRGKITYLTEIPKEDVNLSEGEQPRIPFEKYLGELYKPKKE